MASVIGKKALDKIVANLPEVHDGIKAKTEEGKEQVTENIEAVRATTHWHKIHGPDHLTHSDSSMHDVDGYFSLVAPNAMAIEFGHEPSGVFAGTDTQSPEGLYILTSASFMI